MNEEKNGLVVKITGSEEQIEKITALIEQDFYPLEKSRLRRNEPRSGFHRYLTLKEKEK